MTLHREAGEFEASCDVCGECFPTLVKYSGEHDPDAFRQAVAFLKNNGWKIYKENNEWMQQCPGCVSGKRYGQG